ncbi:protein kinase domain-containing protein [Pseudovibrio sp. WM33]|uniref:protein kinase domain-containing protein n=1 Tax=Pseudovibrio sp. WM33 TaxID=1735585 RepID=UPI0007AE659B|nr:protein kinase [Pseudovibrio sp. WM33]KZL26573.1 Protein kinase domain protein [Pseudovibrio sp. WM33]
MHSVNSPKHTPVDQSQLQNDVSAQQNSAPKKSETLEARGVSVETPKGSTPPTTSNTKPLDTASTETLANRIKPPSQTSSESVTQEATAPFEADRTALEQNAKRLGAGANGEVYLVNQDGKSFAFKVASTEAGWQALQQEAQVYGKIAQIGPHDNIVKSMGIVEVQGVQGLALEHVEGYEAGKLFTTAEKLYTDNKLSHSQYWGTVQFIMRDVLSGVHHLAQAGISHSDIKGGNLLYDKESQAIKIVDFGSAAKIGIDPVTIGTPEALLSLPHKDGDKPRANEKQDTFAVGQMTYRAGEHAENLFGAQNTGDPAALGFALHSKLRDIERRGETIEYQALNQADDPAVAGTPGHFGKGGEIAHVEFVNISTLLDIDVRGTAEELLKTNFISDPLCQPDEARQVISGLMTKMEEDHKAELAALMQQT